MFVLELFFAFLKGISELTSNFHNYPCSHHEHNPACDSHYRSVCGAGHGHIGTAALDFGHNSHQHIDVHNHLRASGYRCDGCALGHDGADKVGFHTDHNSVQCHTQRSISGRTHERWVDIEDHDTGNDSVRFVLDYRHQRVSAGQKCTYRAGSTPGEGQYLILGSLPLR